MYFLSMKKCEIRSNLIEEMFNEKNKQFDEMIQSDVISYLLCLFFL